MTPEEAVTFVVQAYAAGLAIGILVKFTKGGTPA